MSSDISILQRNGCTRPMSMPTPMPMPMARLSSLERMLSSIQQSEAAEDRRSKDEQPPALPHRPVSKARTPPGRRRPVLSTFRSFQSNGGGELMMLKMMNKRTNGEEVAESYHECLHCDDSLDNGFLVLNKNGTTTSIQKGVVEIQKWFRGHKARCFYNDLRRAIISLQTFVRGENARKSYLGLVKINKEDHVQVPHSDVAELQRRVLRAEAELGNKNEENAVLQLRLEQFDRRWQQYEAKMKFMEKMWQDQLASIQARLVAENGRRASENPDRYQNGTNGRVYTIKHYIEQHERGMDDDVPNSDNNVLGSDQQLDSSMNPEKELKKLKFRFKAWNKDYKSRLRETKVTLSRPENTKGKKRWWER